MAQDLTAAPPPPRSPGPFRTRFAVAFGALVLALAGAGVGTWLLWDSDRKQPFSTFVPDEEDPVKRSQQIAAFVSSRYVAEPGAPPVVRVEAGEDDKAALPGFQQVVAVGTNPPGLVSYEYGDILFFRMCASGVECAITPADDPTKLGPLLARQARELALYGLTYVPEADFVITILPPGFVSGPDPKNLPRAVHFARREDLKDELDDPITTTLPDPPPTLATLTQDEATAIEAVMGGTRYSLTSGVDASNAQNLYTLTPLF